ncbi:hypothetical protein [Amorphus orientalis]|uniref:Uncharacterized protein n=1 Tax=Amorphus orientalis TaxID=649198 RepID=A0AAE3VNB0_9HYPH|nr:hypothetical protein [Amorphus orientalis]MDQ0315110.1 hypothetical protein [Amorphus orientalis]
MRLASLIPVSEEELRMPTPAVHREVRARLARALRAERRLGRAGHWSYDLNRHLALKQASRHFGAAPWSLPASKDPPGR